VQLFWHQEIDRLRRLNRRFDRLLGGEGCCAATTAACDRITCAAQA
jgi:hypothetical protein